MKAPVQRLITLNSENIYEITVMGEIDLSWFTGFGEVELRIQRSSGGDVQSTLSNISTDQAGLVGLIRRLHGLGVVLVSVRHAPDVGAPAQGGQR